MTHYITINFVKSKIHNNVDFPQGNTNLIYCTRDFRAFTFFRN